jgi:hypothetical protein
LRLQISREHCQNAPHAIPRPSRSAVRGRWSSPVSTYITTSTQSPTAAGATGDVDEGFQGLKFSPTMGAYVPQEDRSFSYKEKGWVYNQARKQRLARSRAPKPSRKSFRNRICRSGYVHHGGLERSRVLQGAVHGSRDQGRRVALGSRSSLLNRTFKVFCRTRSCCAVGYSRKVAPHLKCSS